MEVAVATLMTPPHPYQCVLVLSSRYYVSAATAAQVGNANH